MSVEKPTINDIARIARVSASTVSRVLNGLDGVTKDKREAVHEAVISLKYRPNLIAQGLARGRSMIIGVITQDIASPFYGRICKEIEQKLRGSDYHPIFVSGQWSAAEENEALNTLIRLQVDGLIILGGESRDEDLCELAKQMPLIAVGRTIIRLENQCLRVNNSQGSYMATCHLINLGHQSIAYIMGITSHPDAIDRYEGYCKALTDAGITVNPDLVVHGDFSEKGGRIALESLLTRGVTFTAIVAANDQMAYGARLGLFNHHLEVPDDISLVGFDNQPMSQYMIPPLTTVEQPTPELGERATEAILDLIDGKPIDLQPLPTNFIKRNSTKRLR